MVPLYPISLNLNGRLCLVVGAGNVASRKVGGLLKAKAQVKVVGLSPAPKIRAWAKDNQIVCYDRAFQDSDLDGCWLAIAATDDNLVNDQVGASAQNKHILFCNAGGGAGDFVAPAVLSRDHLQVAVSTAGASPTYARLLRDYLGDHLVPEHSDILALLKDARGCVQSAHADDPTRRHEILSALVCDDFVDAVQSGNVDQVKKRIKQCLSLLQD